jgi:hypothetical protein
LKEVKSRKRLSLEGGREERGQMPEIRGQEEKIQRAEGRERSDVSPAAGKTDT